MGGICYLIGIILAGYSGYNGFQWYFIFVAINNNQQSDYNYNKIEQLNSRRSYYENAQYISVGMAKTLWN